MTRWLLIFALFWPLSLSAQSQEDEDKGYLTELLEENLSAENQTVTINGFAGALSSEASIEQLTIADADGVWLTLEGAKLIWTRSALLRGAVDIDELSAERLVITRAAAPSGTAPAAEATPFSLPELPVSIAVGALAIDRIELGESFLGEPVNVSLSGSAALSGGEGDANVIATRLDTRTGEFVIEGSYSNATKILDLNALLSEGADGIIARLLDLPGKPALGLNIAGTGPISDYEAQMSLATDGVDRVSGSFVLNEAEGAQTIGLDIQGDVTPLFAPDYREFFGTDVALRTNAEISAAGAVDLNRLEIIADHLQLSGSAAISETGWPERFALDGSMGTPDGEPVLLPISGTQTFVQDAVLKVAFDAAVSDDFQLEIDVSDFRRSDIVVEQLRVDGTGLIREGEDAFATELNYSADGIGLDDAGLAEALGETISGLLQVSKDADGPIKIERLTVDGPGITAEAQGTIKTAEGLEVSSTVALTADQIGRFSALSGLPLVGRAELQIDSTVRPLDGIFDVVLEGITRDLAIGQERVDPLLRGTGALAAALTRDEDGTRVNGLRIETDAAVITGRADLTSGASEAIVRAEIRDLNVIEPSLQGPGELEVEAYQQDGGSINFDIATDIPELVVQAAGSLQLNETGNTLQVTATAKVDDASTYAGLAQRDIGGSIELTGSGVLLGNGQNFDVEIDASTLDLQTGEARLDAVLAGESSLSLDAARVGLQRFLLRELSVATDAITVDASGKGDINSAFEADANVVLAKPGLILPGMTEPLQATLDVDRTAGDVIEVLLRASGQELTLDADVEVTTDADVLEAAGDVELVLGSLRPFADLAGMPLAGSLDGALSGTVRSDLSFVDAELDLRGGDLAIGNATVDPLIAGASRVSGVLRKDGDAIDVQGLNIATREVTASAEVSANGSFGTAVFDARLRDVGMFTDNLSGPLQVDGNASRSDGRWDIDADAIGPGGITASANGRVFDNQTLDIDVNGRLPLGLANRTIAPRRLSGEASFDLGVNGPAVVNSISGRIQTSGARLALPTLAQAVEDLSGSVSLANGSATVDFNGQLPAGGRISISGPAELSPPFQGDIAVGIAEVVLRDPTLYETIVNGDIRATGPLVGGATISGTLNIGATEIQVPSSSVGALGELPAVTHFGQSAAVNRTLRRAGIGAAPKSADHSSTGPSYPLDLTINAPSRIFIRGRGLDAELGGRLTIAGSTRELLPVGQLDLVRGRLNILQQRFDLTEGSASIQGDFEPYLRLVAQTEADTGTLINIIVEGPASNPEVTFESTPELPQDEIFAQLIFGRDLSEISPLQAVQLASAISTLAGRGGGALDSFRQNLGLDDFDVTTDAEGNAAVRAGAYLSENVYTDVTVASDGSTEINLNLDVTEDITAKGTVDADGETSLGIFFERDY